MVDPTATAAGARERLRQKLLATIKTGRITLSSGKTTDFYIDGRLVTLDPEGLELVARLSVEALKSRCEAVGGPTSGADPIVAGIGLAARAEGWPLRLFFTRKSAKAHGTERRIEGPPLQSGDRVALVDDVATTGGSLIGAAQIVHEDSPARVRLALVIVDREEGAGEALRAAGIELVSLFTRSDLLRRSEA